jgi:predicted dehydrogenase
VQETKYTCAKRVLEENCYVYKKDTMANTINWGMIGCGDVTELKSGPAFSKVPNSRLLAVMSRNPERAADYARRHQIDKWYADAAELIADPEVNAIYIATPPDSHEELTLAAIQAGKPVYVEKPMALDAAECQNMQEAASAAGVKLTVAHYRRQQPVFKRIKEMLDEKVIGEIRYVNLEFHAPLLSLEALQEPKTKWRVDPEISGGGLFHDLAPHQIDLMLYFFGHVDQAAGVSANQTAPYAADDIVSGVIRFSNLVIFNGNWCFSAAEQKDRCEIVGTNGSITFSVFGTPAIELLQEGHKAIIQFEPLQHVQQPMIEETVRYFLNEVPNPCPASAGVAVMRVIDSFTGHKY